MHSDYTQLNEQMLGLRQRRGLQERKYNFCANKSKRKATALEAVRSSSIFLENA